MLVNNLLPVSHSSERGGTVQKQNTAIGYSTYFFLGLMFYISIFLLQIVAHKK